MTDLEQLAHQLAGQPAHIILPQLRTVANQGYSQGHLDGTKGRPTADEDYDSPPRRLPTAPGRDAGGRCTVCKAGPEAMHSEACPHYPPGGYPLTHDKLLGRAELEQLDQARRPFPDQTGLAPRELCSYCLGQGEHLEGCQWIEGRLRDGDGTA